MITEMTKSRDQFRGWIFFDGRCPACLRLARRFGPMLRRRGYRLNPLQDPWVASTLGLTLEQLLVEMKLLSSAGELFGGADALLYVAQDIPALRPIRWLALRVPGVHRLLVSIYRWVADHRYCATSAGCPSEGGQSCRR